MSYKALHISGSFGPGQVNRGLAIANEMRRICPGIEIHWLAGSPACEVLEAAGEACAPEQAADRGEYTIIVGDDETYEILIANLSGFYRLPPIPFIVLYDFLGMEVISKNVFEKPGAWRIDHACTQGGINQHFTLFGEEGK